MQVQRVDTTSISKGRCLQRIFHFATLLMCTYQYLSPFHTHSCVVSFYFTPQFRVQATSIGGEPRISKFTPTLMHTIARGFGALRGDLQAPMPEGGVSFCSSILPLSRTPSETRGSCISDGQEISRGSLFAGRQALSDKL